MAKLILDNLPDELLQQIEKLAQQKNNSVNEQTISLLKAALAKTETPLKIMVSPDNDPTWEERRKNTAKVLQDIRNSRRVNPDNFGLLDSTELIREDRDR
jgi:antitoxin FitA